MVGYQLLEPLYTTRLMVVLVDEGQIEDDFNLTY